MAAKEEKKSIEVKQFLFARNIFRFGEVWMYNNTILLPLGSKKWCSEISKLNSSVISKMFSYHLAEHVCCVMRVSPFRYYYNMIFEVMRNALVAAIVVSLHAGHLLEHEGLGQYMENIFPLYRANVYYWRRLWVNYLFICGFKQGTELAYISFTPCFWSFSTCIGCCTLPPGYGYEPDNKNR